MENLLLGYIFQVHLALLCCKVRRLDISASDRKTGLGLVGRSNPDSLIICLLCCPPPFVQHHFSDVFWLFRSILDWLITFLLD